MAGERWTDKIIYSRVMSHPLLMRREMGNEWAYLFNAAAHAVLPTYRYFACQSTHFGCEYVDGAADRFRQADKKESMCA
jgi:hypothetical protein